MRLNNAHRNIKRTGGGAVIYVYSQLCKQDGMDGRQSPYNTKTRLIYNPRGYDAGKENEDGFNHGLVVEI